MSSQPGLMRDRGTRGNEGIDDQRNGRGPSVTLHLNGWRFFIEHDDHHLIARSAANVA
jgi:hypothetical protein